MSCFNAMTCDLTFLGRCNLVAAERRMSSPGERWSTIGCCTGDRLHRVGCDGRQPRDAVSLPPARLAKCTTFSAFRDWALAPCGAGLRTFFGRKKSCVSMQFDAFSCTVSRRMCHREPHVVRRYHSGHPVLRSAATQFIPRRADP